MKRGLICIPVLVILSLPSVAGPFTLSKSLADYCRETNWIACQQMNQFLAQLRAEPRDEKWATSREDLLKRKFLAAGRKDLEIRALECRRSLCAIEYSLRIDIHTELDFGGLDGVLEPVTGAFAPEVDHVSGHRSVTVMGFKAAGT